MLCRSRVFFQSHHDISEDVFLQRFVSQSQESSLLAPKKESDWLIPVWMNRTEFIQLSSNISVPKWNAYQPLQCAALSSSTLTPVVLNLTSNITNNIGNNKKRSSCQSLVNTDAFTHCTTSQICATLFSTAQCGFNFASLASTNCWNVINTHTKNNHKTPQRLIFQDHYRSYADELQRGGSAENKAVDSASGNMESV